MIELSVPVFLVMLETFFVIAALMVYGFVKAHRASRAARVRHPVRAVPTAVAYLDHELQQTRARLKAAGDSAPTALKLRAGYLDIERECAGQPDRDESFWAAVSGRLSALEKPAKAAAAQPVAAKSIDTRALLESTAKKIESLKEHVVLNVADLEQRSELLRQIDQVGRVNRELADCVAVLEDDNNLLRSEVPVLTGGSSQDTR
ncbi:MAG: hypothetical protein ACYDHM_10840 [Acidiferrobacterales bacterium]